MKIINIIGYLFGIIIGIILCLDGLGILPDITDWLKIPIGLMLICFSAVILDQIREGNLSKTDTDSESD